ncbi:Rv2231c family pyridoxal phosphate-dependent protein CobC [Nocardia ignorata]|uniref:Histidinol-phosphate aminotransferase n=1 Tax=Nocardia ignorata TaxID=145285 RepID=A0A4R6PM23_NOCIG|nr:Rv2231c family pyridoxal phosphate-dependent protein CobC [Nocardia ignorata]TDP38850.1 histidinol-phosphate aminotransferase [Nocardia ignorata]
MFEDSVDPAMLRHHGDVEARPGMLDFAVNVQGTAPPAWLRARLTARLTDLGRYPDAAEELAARTAVAARHGRAPDEVLLLAGAAEGFAMLPRLRPRLAAVIHPSFTEPELALREAGVPVTRVVLERPYTLDPTRVPEEADLVVLGNPTNPTSILHPAETIQALRRPGRLVVVDEAFADAVAYLRASAGSSTARPEAGGAATQRVEVGGAAAHRVDAGGAAPPSADVDAVPGAVRPKGIGGELESLAGLSAPDVLVLRSLTKTWALAGLRCGYVLGAPEVLARLTQGRPHWPLGTLQLEAIRATAEPAAVAESQHLAQRIAADRDAMIDRLTALGIDVHTPATGPFLLLRVTDGALVRKHLADRGIAVRRADTFPGLGPDHLRVAVRGRAEVDQLIDGLRAALW